MITHLRCVVADPGADDSTPVPPGRKKPGSDPGKKPLSKFGFDPKKSKRIKRVKVKDSQQI